MLGERPDSWRAAEQAMDKIVKRFGAGAVKPAALVPDEQARTGGPVRPGGRGDGPGNGSGEKSVAEQ
jgi:hypothetical protein